MGMILVEEHFPIPQSHYGQNQEDRVMRCKEFKEFQKRNIRHARHDDDPWKAEGQVKLRCRATEWPMTEVLVSLRGDCHCER